MAGGRGTVWTLEHGDDLNANLVRLVGGNIGEHTNDEVDVLMLGVSGAGAVEVEGQRHELGRGALVFVPRGARRSVHAGPEGLAYLSVHRRRGPLAVGGPEESGAKKEGGS
jgi:quercetin dioxygenase-like cupin family protein